MQVFYRNRKNLSASFRLRARVCQPELRACQGRRVSRVAAKRKEILERKVYERGDTTRPLTRNLINSEQIRLRGPVAEIRNVAPYAGIRDQAEGQSQLYGHDLELHFALGAVQETAKENRDDTRQTLRGVMNAGS
jgi:hypothetical protein